MHQIIKHKKDILIALMCIAVAIGYNAACSALTILVIFAHEIADKYFDKTIYDHSKKDLEVVKAELAKVTSKVAKYELTGAFGAHK